MFAQVITIPLLMAAMVVLVVLSAFGVHVASFLLGGTAHTAEAVYGFAALCTFLSVWLVLQAVFAYLNVGQAKKIEVITGFYTPATIADYFDQFWSGRDGIRDLVVRYRTTVDTAKVAAGQELEKKFKELFASDFGLQVFIVPVILLIAIGSVVMFFGFTGGIGLAIARSSSHPSPVQPFGITLDLISIAAIFGAYTWIASDVIVRNHQWTLHPSDLGWYSLRLIVAIPLGQALALTVSTANVTGGAAITQTGSGAFLAFAVSLFSLDAITNALGTAATRLGVQMQSSNQERDDLVVKLAGVDDVRARALSVEGVSTVAQLVTVDPIRLSIRTGLAFEYILNLIDAALLWVFVGTKLTVLGQLGLRGASDVLALNDAWHAPFTAALIALRQAGVDAAAAEQTRDQAQTALNAEQTKAAGPDLAVITTLTATLTAAGTAVTAAVATRAEAVADFLAVPDSPAGLAVDRKAMLTALTTKTADGGPGLVDVGFDAICERLKSDSYAIFIRRLLES